MVKGGKAPVFITVPERYFGVDAIADIKPVGVVLGGCKYDLGFGHISRVEVDPSSCAVPCLKGEAFLDPGGIELDRGQVSGVQQAFEENKLPLNAGSHFFPVEIRIRPGSDLALIINRAIFPA